MNNDLYLFINERPTKPGLWAVVEGHTLERLRVLPDDLVQCWVTSPPYYKQVDYGMDGQYGLEDTVDEYIENQKRVAAEMLRVSQPSANLFWIVRDTFNGTGSTGSDYRNGNGSYRMMVKGAREPGWPRKAQLLIPERTRIAFQEVGWVPILSITWDRNNPRRSAKDRPSYSDERCLWFKNPLIPTDNGQGLDGLMLDDQILLFAAAPDHFWDRAGVLQRFADSSMPQLKTPYKGQARFDYGAVGEEPPSSAKRRMCNSMKGCEGALLRSVWNIPSGSQPVVEVDGKLLKGRASFPLLLAEICVNLGSAPGEIVADPYCGFGTTLLAAAKWGRNAIGIELNPESVIATKARMKAEGY